MKSRINHLFAAELVILLGLASAARAINPVLVTNIIGASYGTTSVAISGKTAYIANDCGGLPESGLRIYDISNPANPAFIYGDGGTFCGTLVVSGDYAYAIYDFGLHILNVSDPSNPVLAGIINGNWNDVTLSGHFAFLDGSIFDVSNPAAPTKLGQVAGGPTVINGDYAYCGSAVYDISNPSNPSKLADTGIWGYDLASAGGYIYAAAWTNGLFIWDISNATNPAVVGHAWASGFSVAASGNYVYLTAGAILSVVDISDPTNPVFVSEVNTLPGNVGSLFSHMLAVSGDYSYAAQTGGLAIYSLGIPAPNLTIQQSNNLVLSWPTPTGAFSVQENPDLNPAHWTNLTNTSEVVASQNQITVPKPNGTMFYRLVSQ